jgi:hypothetical protein
MMTVVEVFAAAIGLSASGPADCSHVMIVVTDQ